MREMEPLPTRMTALVMEPVAAVAMRSNLAEEGSLAGFWGNAGRAAESRARRERRRAISIGICRLKWGWIQEEDEDARKERWEGMWGAIFS